MGFKAGPVFQQFSWRFLIFLASEIVLRDLAVIFSGTFFIVLVGIDPRGLIQLGFVRLIETTEHL